MLEKKMVWQSPKPSRKLHNTIKKGWIVIKASVIHFSWPKDCWVDRKMTVFTLQLSCCHQLPQEAAYYCASVVLISTWSLTNRPVNTRTLCATYYDKTRGRIKQQRSFPACSAIKTLLLSLLRAEHDRSPLTAPQWPTNRTSSLTASAPEPRLSEQLLIHVVCVCVFVCVCVYDMFVHLNQAI